MQCARRASHPGTGINQAGISSHGGFAVHCVTKEVAQLWAADKGCLRPGCSKPINSSVSLDKLFHTAQKGLVTCVPSEAQTGSRKVGLEGRGNVESLAVTAEHPAGLAGSWQGTACPHTLPRAFAPLELSMLRSQSSTRTKQPAVRSLSGGESQAWRKMMSG